MKKRILSLALASAMAVGTVSGAFAETEATTKTNVPYIQGNQSGEFMPNSDITRQEIAVMIGKALELEGSNPDFKDADKIAAWADEFVAGLQDAEIVEGDEAGNFNPTNKITRAELATMVVRAYESVTGEELSEGDTSFDDVADSAWYASAVKKAAEAGLVKGNGAGSFNPAGNATRAETVMMINRVLGLGEDNLPSNVAEVLETELNDSDEWPSWAVDAILVASTAFEYTVGEDGKIVISDEEPPVQDGLVVESVSAITATSVTVEIAELEEDLADATVTVKDGSGKVYAVTPMDLKAGATSATFNFVTPLTVNPTSQWTVNGVKYAPENFEIVDVEAITDTGKYLEVTFNSELDALDASEVKVRNKNTLKAHGVEAVTLSTDKMSAKVTMLGDEVAGDILEPGNIYTLSITQDGEVVSADFEIPAVAEEAYVESVDAEERTIDLRVPTGTLVLNVPEDMVFDFEDALGREMTAWYDKEGNVTRTNFSSQTVKYDAIEILAKNGNNYVKFESDDSEARIDNAVQGTFTDIVEFIIDGNALAANQKYEYAKVVFNSSNRVEAIVAVQAFDGDILVESMDGDIAQGYEDEINLEDYTIVKNGKTISTSDIVAGDMISYNVNAEYAEVYNNKVTGTIDGIFDGKFEVDGKVYEITKDGKTAKVIEDGEIRALEQDDLEALQEGGEVTLNLDRNGRVAIVSGSFGEVTTAKSGVYLSGDALAYYEATRGTMEIEYKTTSGVTVTDKFRLSQLEEITVGSTTYEVGEKIGVDKIDGFKFTDGAGNVDGASTIAIAAVRSDNAVLQDNIITVASLAEGSIVEVIKDEAGNVVGLELDNTKSSPDFGAITDNQLKLTDSYIEVTTGVNKNVKSTTPVFLEEVEDGTTTVTATTWGELEGFTRIRTLDVYWKDADVNYLVIDKADTNSEKELKSSKALLTEVLLHADTTDVARIKAFVNGTEVVYNVAKSDEIDSNGLVKGDLAEIVIDENTGKVDSLNAASNTVRGGAFDVNTASKKFSLSNNGTTKTDLEGSASLAVYEIDGTSITKVGISNLSTAANEEYEVTAYRSAAGSKYVDIVVIDKDTTNTNGTTYKTAATDLAEDVAALTADDIKNLNSSLSNVKTDLSDFTGAGLTVGEVNASTIAWNLNNAGGEVFNGVIVNDGTVTRPSYDATVALPNITGNIVATLTNAGVSQDKTFNVTVIGLTPAATGTVAGGTADFANGVALSGLNVVINDDEGTSIAGLALNNAGFTFGNPTNLTGDLVGKTITTTGGDLTVAGLASAETGTFELPVTDAAGNTFTLTVTVTQS